MTTRPSTRSFSIALLTAWSATISALPAHASAAVLSSGCSTDSNTLNCKLQNVLPALYLTSAILALVLIVSIVVAVRLYRKIKDDDERNSRRDERRRG